MITASAPAKLILCGEHAVVYGRPAIALPLGDIRAQASVGPAEAGAGPLIVAPDLGAPWLAREQPDHPLSELALLTLERLGRSGDDVRISLSSAIPIASGMGSGAAIGTAMVRALAAHAGAELGPATVAELVYASERRFHGTPSGIDNTVVAYERAIWFVRASGQQATTDNGRRTTDDRAAAPGLASEEAQQPASQPPTTYRQPPAASAPTIEPIAVGAPLTLVIGDTGVRSATRLPVGAVREAWQADTPRYEALFDAIGALVLAAREALAAGDALKLGGLLDANQAILEQLGVSSPELGRLVAAARGAGALGAKLSGAGWGGVMLALVAPESRHAVEAALREAGAIRVLGTTVAAS
jgi:mevalonate kinase